MIEAFGVPVLNSDGVPHNNKWSKIWGRITKLRGENLLTTRRLYCKTAHFIYQIEVNAFGLRVKSSEVFILSSSISFSEAFKQDCQYVQNPKQKFEIIHNFPVDIYFVFCFSL